VPDFIRAPHDQQPVETDISICPGLYVKTAVFTVGTYTPQHAHDFDHLSVVATGAVRVWADGQLLGDYAAPVGIHIKARVKHLFLALVDRTTVLCIHRLNDAGEIGIAEEHQIVED
jgi:quercetin dioxygenase-like cupin family protein